MHVNDTIRVHHSLTYILNTQVMVKILTFFQLPYNIYGGTYFRTYIVLLFISCARHFLFRRSFFLLYYLVRTTFFISYIVFHFLLSRTHDFFLILYADFSFLLSRAHDFFFVGRFFFLLSRAHDFFFLSSYFQKWGHNWCCAPPHFWTDQVL